jgi:UDP-N-acetylmuramoylalanine--D-glutamate ligase
LDKFKAEFEPTGLLQGLYLGAFDPAIFCATDIELVIVSPGVAISHPIIQQARAQGKKVIGDIELFAHEVKKYCPLHQIIGITGSNGKSTVTTLVGELLSAYATQKIKVIVAGNIGLPVLSALDNLIEINKPLDNILVYFVLELSSFQLETTDTLELETAVILNISPNHLDRYDGSVLDYAKAKHRIYAHAKHIIYNREDKSTYPKFNSNLNKNLTLTFGLDIPHENQFGIIPENNEKYLAYGSEKLLPVSELSLMGQHNYANVLTSLAVIKSLGIKLTPDMISALTQFTGLSHRCEWVANINQVQYINDSKGTSTGATIASIEGLGPTLTGKIILIAGGDGKGADFSQITPVLKKYVQAVVLIGRDANKIAQIIPDNIPSYMAETLDKAVPMAQSLAKPGNTVLLSPVCASWDQYPSYIARGEHFKSCVLKLSNGYNQ